MKRTLLFILAFLPMLASAQTASDVQYSGCQKETRGNESQKVQTIVLTKEGSVLSVQMLNYESNCCTEDFNVTSRIRKDGDYDEGTWSTVSGWWVFINVEPVGEDCDCVCPFNVSFTVRDLESNSFYLDCWWYRGYLELTEGEPYVMAIIDDIYYHLFPSINEAEVIQVLNYPSNYTGNVEIPEKVVCNGTEYRVTSIQKSAFSGCRELTSVTIPNSITKIEETTFANCLGLTSVNIPNSVTSIGEHAFYDCKGLTSVSIPNSVTEILNSAFRDCSSLTSITIPSSVAKIEEGAFAGCSDLRSIVVEEGNTVYDSRERCNAIIKTSDNELITGCMNTTIPNSVTTISRLAFFNCIKLTNITIPNGVTKIGSYAFQECSELTSVTIPGSVTEIGENAFIRCRKLRSLTIHDGVIVIGNGAFAGCRSLNSFIIPNSVTTIGEGAFHACESLTSIAIPNKVTSIGSYSFAGCKSLTSATIPNSVTKIGYKAFDHCSSLTSIIIPNSVTEIGMDAFSCCSSLTSVIISNNITSINCFR